MKVANKLNLEMSRMDSGVIVLSGGMDSVTLATYMAKERKRIYAITFDYGSKHAGREIEMAMRTVQKLGINHKIVELPFINQLFRSNLLKSGPPVPDGRYDDDVMSKTVVPFRNAILMSIAVGYAQSIGASSVLLGSHSGDHHIYPDCRPEFNEAFRRTVALGTENKVQVHMPFNHMDKRDIGDLGRAIGVNFKDTWTCYKGGAYHCGTCGSCDERKYALRHEEGKDPTIYMTDKNFGMRPYPNK
jgi:7-cyano-7-deazaguanine synthase